MRNRLFRHFRRFRPLFPFRTPRSPFIQEIFAPHNTRADDKIPRARETLFMAPAFANQDISVGDAMRQTVGLEEKRGRANAFRAKMDAEFRCRRQ